MSAATLSDQEFVLIQRLFEQETGIRLGAAKKVLVASRLHKRLTALQLPDFGAYCRMISQPQAAEEKQRAVDLLTTNETYFFREPQHFELLAAQLGGLRQAGQPLRVWSAACSSGEEVYSIAMVLAEHFGIGGPWEVLGSDVSTEVLARAQRAQYSLARVHGIPQALLKRYCLRGTGAHNGSLLVDPALSRRARFAQINLMRPLPRLPQFDVVFLRNVLIYFDAAGKQRMLDNVLTALRPGGLLIVGHSESLQGLRLPLQAVAPASYRRLAHA